MTYNVSSGTLKTTIPYQMVECVGVQVYLILMSQLSVTFAVVCIFMF